MCPQFICIITIQSIFRFFSIQTTMYILDKRLFLEIAPNPLQSPLVRSANGYHYWTWWPFSIQPTQLFTIAIAICAQTRYELRICALPVNNIAGRVRSVSCRMPYPWVDPRLDSVYECVMCCILLPYRMKDNQQG